MMPSNVGGPGAAVPAGTPGHSARAGEAVTGEWNGLSVAAGNDPISLLADAAEEMTFAASETVEKDVADRKKPSTDKRGVAMVAPSEEAMAEMQRSMAERLAKLLAALKQAGGNPAAFRAALEEIGDATERHAALCWLEEQLAGEPSLRDMARREREALEQSAAAEIQAGYNIVGVDAGVVGGGEAGREAYTRVIMGHDDVSAMLEDILARHGDADFAGAVDFLMRAVGADLSAANPSTDKRDLEAMNNDLYQLRALGNFTREFGAAVDGLRERAGKESLPNAGVETLRVFCKAKNDRIVTVDRLKGSLGLEGAKDPTYDVRALTRAFDLAHSLPAKLFADEDSRGRLLVAVQKMLDAAVDLEDETLAEGE